jgi:hypothetical protein
MKIEMTSDGALYTGTAEEIGTRLQHDIGELLRTGAAREVFDFVTDVICTAVVGGRDWLLAEVEGMGRALYCRYRPLPPDGAWELCAGLVQLERVIHPFMRGRGGGRVGPPDQTCALCKLDPRNAIHLSEAL